PSVPEATWLLAKLHDRRGKLTAALELYKLIPPDHKRASAARAAIARTYEKILDRLRELHEPIDSWEDEAISALQKLTSLAGDRNAAGGFAGAEVPVRLARILLRTNPPRFEEADKILRRAEASLPAAKSADWDSADAKTESANLELRAMVRQLEVVSLAGQG